MNEEMLIQRVEDVVGSRADAIRWVTSPKLALGGQIPLYNINSKG
ncbi:MAG: MbcA/ParS/Xre antitoxin family protein [Gammaproteobacteria bacterium]|nr:MbcA/ParS/Xre antitoxin family protein [Gammaproteobacteria bacterium]